MLFSSKNPKEIYDLGIACKNTDLAKAAKLFKSAAKDGYGPAC